VHGLTLYGAMSGWFANRRAECKADGDDSGHDGHRCGDPGPELADWLACGHLLMHSPTHARHQIGGHLFRPDGPYGAHHCAQVGQFGATALARGEMRAQGGRVPASQPCRGLLDQLLSQLLTLSWQRIGHVAPAD
jgi:hypothetical protein